MGGSKEAISKPAPEGESETAPSNGVCPGDRKVSSKGMDAAGSKEPVHSERSAVRIVLEALRLRLLNLIGSPAQTSIRAAETTCIESDRSVQIADGDKNMIQHGGYLG
jgi:hypothetical protein